MKRAETEIASPDRKAEKSVELKAVDLTTKPQTAAQESTVVPMTVAGQRYISPPGRHSQQKRRLAIQRAEALGFTTARELHDYDRQAVLAKLQKSADGIVSQQRNEQNRRSGAPADKA